VCCSFARKNPDDRIEVNLDLDVLDATYISQVKRKCEIEVGQNYNLAKSEDARQPQCPEEKEKVIMEALEHFRLV
jgi:23S rRNA (uracil1939-C5)-methyltransferase